MGKSQSPNVHTLIVAAELGSIEDETGIANVIITPDVYERNRLTVTRSKFLLVEGTLQNQGGVIHVKAVHLSQLAHRALDLSSHDFH